jgi:uncharacterized damage-inducible protein DinB
VNADQAIFLRDFLCETIEKESLATKRVLAALPDDQKALRHGGDPKARTAWELATHLAGADVWFLNSIADGAFVPPGGGVPATTVAELVSWYDSHLGAALGRVRGLSAEELIRDVDFRGLFTQPACQYLTFMSHHSVHHRAQLGTYLRPAGARVPVIYGRSADSQ